jgi:serine/threonine protein kinase
VEQISFTPPTLEALNELLPSYQFTDFIAKGGMGAVYRATQTSLDRDVAIKVLPPELSTDPEFHASFRTEARAMARLNHPNLVGIYDSGEMDGMLYIVMEYVAGKSLYHSCWNKQIDPDEVKRIITAICEGLHHAHENGIIHRDIKPANILLTPKVEPKIGDFGLAQAVGSKYEGIVMGTPGYAAPEIISHPEKMDRRSDIFAVGVMLYEMLVGKLPTPGSLPSQACKCPPGFDTIYQKATHPNAAMRYTDAKKLSEALRSLIIAQNSTRRLQGNPPRGVANTTARARPVSATKPVARPISAPKPVARPTAPARPMARPMSVAEALAPQVIPEPVEYEVVAPPAITEPEIAPPSPAPEVLPPEEVALQDLDVVAEPLDVPTLDDQNPVSKWPLVRNLTIICILLAAFVFAYLYHNNQKNNNQQQEESAR